MKNTAVVVLTSVLSLPGLPVPPALPVLSPQSPFDQAVGDLANPDVGARRRAVRTLKAAGLPEAAIPLAALVFDSDDEVQAEAIAAELNIFLAEKVVPRRRVALVIEVRNAIGAEAAFSGGPFALNGNAVPAEVLAAFLRASHDDNPHVALDALYAFGALAGDAPDAERRELLRVAGPELAGALGVPALESRIAAARVIGRVFARRPVDPPVEEAVGDAVVLALNDRERDVRLAAIDALGSMRYERAVQTLTDLHQYYRRGEIGGAALQALAQIGHGSSVPLFQTQLAPLRRAGAILAIEGLARVGDAGRAPEIRAALARERNKDVLLAEHFALVLLAGGPLDPLFAALADSKLRDQTMGYLVEVAPGRAAAFARQAQNPVARRRADVAQVLGVSRDPAALAVVEPLMQDGDPQVASAAQRAAARLRRLP